MPEREDHKATWLKALGGDEEALSEMYRQHYLSLINYGSTLVDDRDLVSDCFVQMLVELWETKKMLPAVENVRSYLMTTLRRAILYKIKTTKHRDNKFSESMSLDIGHQWSYEEHLVKIQSDRNLKSKISNAIGKLTDRQKELVKLKFFENLGYDEIAERSGITKRTAYNIIHDAIKILKDELYLDHNSSFQSFFLFLI
jgi:RNA polymerase sigma factor (sigma-70 family)